LQVKLVERIDEVLEAAFAPRPEQDVLLEMAEEILPIEKPVETERRIHA
jgi:predicted ATP-dependent protease